MLALCGIVGLGWLIVPAKTFAQTEPEAVLSGYVRDRETGESLFGASVHLVSLDSNERWSTTTQNSGFYSVRLRTGKWSLQVSSVGYLSQKLDIEIVRDTLLRLTLSKGAEIEMVEISGKNSGNSIRNPQMGLSKVEMADVKFVPVLFGERDILKTIQLLPGVMAGGEGSSDFFVRGGMGDQNLILLDGANVFNASHLLGFFSTFNSDAIKDVNLYKGGMPAEFGGRLSSVLDINMIEGNNQNYSVEGGLGLIASRIKVEGPIVKGRSSFMVSGRRTYADMFLKLSKDSMANQSKLFFYDLNLKANYRFSDRDAIYLSGYFGEDVLGYADEFGFRWGNNTTSVRWQHMANPSLFWNSTLVFSNYRYKVELMDPAADFVIASHIRSGQWQQKFQWFPSPEHTVHFGLDVKHQEILPTNIEATEASSINSMFVEKRRALEGAVYISDEWKVTPDFEVHGGVRLNQFALMGPGTFQSYAAEDGSIVDTRTRSGYSPVKTYFSFEPRLSASYMVNAFNSIKASYNRNSQNLHQLTNTTSSLPTDSWVMSSPNIKPQQAEQWAIGYYGETARRLDEFSVELYYKDMRNQIDFRDGANLQGNMHIESELVFGTGRAYGVEWYYKFDRGPLNGWISYTLAKSERHFDAINEGNWYPARQDRTHDLSMVLMYQLSPKWNVSSTFVYSSGQAVTFPTGKYEIDGQLFWYYGYRNQHRMPDYHRLDLGVNYEAAVSQRFRSTWSFGVYNAYNRKNAYIIDFRENEITPAATDIYKISLFGIIPSVTWNFKF